MRRQMAEDGNIEEICSVCERPFKKGDGRFRRSDKNFCVECYYKLNPEPRPEEESRKLNQ